MRTSVLSMAAAALLGSASPKPVSYALVQPSQYQSFVANWKPQSQPLCAAIASAAQWKRVFQPAAVMGAHPPFAPPDAFWQKHEMLVVARVVNAGETAQIFHVDGVTSNGAVMNVSYRFRPTPAASSTMKSWLGIVIAKPLPTSIHFIENSHTVCRLDLAGDAWLQPR